MNNLFLDDNKIMDFELLSDRSIKNYFYSNIVIYYVLEGTLTLSSCDETFELKSGDYIFVWESRRCIGTATNKGLL